MGVDPRLESDEHTPLQNRLLAALPRADYEHLRPHLEPVALPLGRVVHDAGIRQDLLYFLTSGIVCRSYVTRTGASAGFALAGREGVVGVASFLGGESTPSRAVVLVAGYAYRLRIELLRQEFKHDGPLPRLLLRYMHALFTQIGQVAVCNRHHSVEQQVCRWLLSCIERLPANEMAITQERLAEMLGVRREGVSEEFSRLQRAGLIECSRGHIAVLDRAQLEARACECHAVITRAYERLRADDRPIERPAMGLRAARTRRSDLRSAACA